MASPAARRRTNRRPNEFLVANVGRARRETLNGRAYRVAPVTMIVPGVLPGSDGPGYYPPGPCAAGADRWNGIPLVAPTHPTVKNADGTLRHVSARSPRVAEKYKVGTVYEASFDGKLVAEAWIDEIKANKVDPRILERLDAGLPLEVSTGLRVKRVPAAPGSVYNGRPYDWVAAEHVPDHLAILLDGPGACSVADGCGIHNAAKGGGSNCGTGAGGFKPGNKCATKGLTPEADQVLQSIATHGQPFPPGHIQLSSKDRKALTVVFEKGWARQITKGPVVIRSELTDLGKSVMGTSVAPQEKKESELEQLAKHTKKDAQGGVKIRREFGTRNELMNTGKVKAMRCPGCKQKVSTADQEAGKCKACGAAIEPPIGTPPPTTNSPAPDHGDPDMKLSPAQRKEHVSFLTANCACWKGKDDAKILENFDDDKLGALKANAEQGAAHLAVVNATKEALGDDALTVNAMPAAIKAVAGAKKKGDEENACLKREAAAKTAAAPTGNQTDTQTINQTGGTVIPTKPKTLAEWEAEAPPEVLAIHNHAKRLVAEEKAKFVAVLTAPIVDATAKAGATAVYNAMAPDALRALVNAMPKPTTTTHPQPAYGAAYDPYAPASVDPYAGILPPPVFYGAGDLGGPANGQQQDEPEILGRPTINWAELRDSQRKSPMPTMA